MPWGGVNAIGRVRRSNRRTPGALWETESRGGPDDSPNLTEELEPQTPRGHSRVQAKPEGAPGPLEPTPGSLRTASVGAERDTEATRGAPGCARVTQELVTGSMGWLLGSCFVALWACTLIEVGRGVCGPCPEAGTPVVSPARSHCPGCLLLSALGLESASRLTQAVDVGHGSWLLAVGEKCPDLLAHGGRSYHSSHEWRQCSGNMKCDSCGFKFSRGPCLFPGDRLDQGQKWRRHRLFLIEG